MIIKKEFENFYMLKWLDKYMIGHKGFIAGGCFKNIFNGEKVKDLDMFFECENDFYEADNYFNSMTESYGGEDKRDTEYFFYYENEKVKAYKNIESGIVVELICKTYGKPKDILENFDFTIAKFAYYKEEIKIEKENPFSEKLEFETEIQYSIMCDDCFFEHLHLKRLVVDDKIPFPMSTFERMIRYIGYGYKPCKDTKLKIARSINELDEKQVETKENLYDGFD